MGGGHFHHVSMKLLNERINENMWSIIKEKTGYIKKTSWQYFMKTRYSLAKKITFVHVINNWLTSDKYDIK